MSRYKMYTCHPDWQGETADLFDKNYEQIVRIHYSLRDPMPKPIAIKPNSIKRCALCLKEPPVANFSHVAHLLPASLGNRQYITHEECDNCNGSYGESYENALANMLAVERAFYRIRSRKGTAKLRPTDGGSYIGGGPYNQGLHIQIDRTDDSISTEEKTNGTLVVTAKNPSFNSTHALKSILKSFWLSVHESTRQEYEYIRKYLIGELILEKSEFFRFFLQDALDAVVFEAWQRKTSNLNSSDIVIRLTISHTSIVWCSPDKSTMAHIPSLFPPFEQNDPLTSLEVVKVLCLPESSLVRSHDVHFTIGFDPKNRVKTVDNEDARPIPLTPGDTGISTDDDGAKGGIGTTEVILEATRGNDVRRIVEAAHFVSFRCDRQYLIFRLFGGEFANDVLMQFDSERDTISYRDSWKLHCYSAAQAKRTIELLMLAYEPDSKLTIIHRGSGRIIFSIPFYRGQPMPPSLPIYHEMLDNICTLNDELEINLTVPRLLIPYELELSRRLVRILKEGCEEGPTQGIFFEMESNQCDQLRHYVESNSSSTPLTIRQTCYPIKFLGITVDLGPIRVVLTSPQIDRTSESVSLQNGTSAIVLRSEKTAVYYERWGVAQESPERARSARGD